MRKTFLFAVMMMGFTCAKAQLVMTSTGKLNLHSPSSPTAQMNIESSNTNLKGVRTGTINSGYGPVIEGQNSTNGNHWAMGVRGTAWGSSGAINCGVFGIATGSTSYQSHGVVGCLYSTTTCGAGIYGANSWSVNDTQTFNKAYAGYFKGDVHIQGNFSYSGTLLMSLPLPSTILSEPLRSRRGNGVPALTTLLQTIDVQSYHHKDPPSALLTTLNEENFAGMDSMEIEAIKRSLAISKEAHDIIAEQIYTKTHYGLDADQLEKVFPDLVYENEDGTKSINYVEMVPILVQAINELSAKVEVLEGNNTSKKAAIRSTTNVDGMGENVVLLSLGQNKPNPFGTTTSIEVSIPEDVQKAFIYIYDLQGKKADQVDITARGKQTVQLDASTLSDGMYLYSLIVDGKVVETRRMIVEK